MENNPSNDSYLSIGSASEGLFKDNGSRFIALAFPVETESEIKEIISSIKKEYHDARHHCYAYRLGYKGDIFRANDDGEPSSSAGRPILGQIDANSLSDILVVVVRYFGGIKLGYAKFYSSEVSYNNYKDITQTVGINLSENGSSG